MYYTINHDLNKILPHNKSNEKVVPLIEETASYKVKKHHQTKGLSIILAKAVPLSKLLVLNILFSVYRGFLAHLILTYTLTHTHTKPEIRKQTS